MTMNMNDDITAARSGTHCPKCGLAASTLLHRFCQHEVCPVRLPKPEPAKSPTEGPMTFMDEDLLTDILDDSMDIDWTPRVGAKAIIRAYGAFLAKVHGTDTEPKPREQTSISGTD